MHNIEGTGRNNLSIEFSAFIFFVQRVKCIGFARRRRGRGGRIVLDRISTNMDEFWANLDYTIYSGNTKLTAKEICRRYELKKQQQSIKDQSQSVVIDLEPTNRPKSPSLLTAQSSTSNDDKTEYIVIKTEEKTVNETLDAANRTNFNSANATINKHFDLKRNDVNMATTTSDTITNRINGTVNILNTDNNNNSGNNSNSSKNNNNNSSNNANNRLSNLNNMFRLSPNASADVRRHFNFAHSSPFGSSPFSSMPDNVVDTLESTSTTFQQNSNSSLSSKV